MKTITFQVAGIRYQDPAAYYLLPTTAEGVP